MASLLVGGDVAASGPRLPFNCLSAPEAWFLGIAVTGQRDWHHGIARQYLLALPFVVLAFAHSPSWLGAPLLGALARVAKSLWVRREGRGLFWLLNPIQFAGVGVILAAIDLATFVGWVQARCSADVGPEKDNANSTTEHTESTEKELRQQRAKKQPEGVVRDTESHPEYKCI